MATITRENIAPLTDKLTVNLAKEDYYPSFEKSLKDYAKKANIPGFRKGMVPAGLVKKMYGASVFTDEVLRTVEKQLNQYVTEEKLDILGQPLPMENNTPAPDMNNPRDYAFAFEVGLKPDVQVNLNDVKVTRYKVEVTDAMIDEEVARLQMRNGKMTNPETVDNEGNVLNVELKEADENGTETEGGIKKDTSLVVKYFTPEYREQLMGKKVDDTLTIQLSKAFEDKEREFIMSDLALDKNSAVDADKRFILIIKKIGMTEKADLAEEFFNAAYPGRNITNEQELRDAVKADIENYYAQQSSNQLHDQIYHYLTDHVHFNFPDAFLKRWLQMNTEKQKTSEEVDEEYPNYAKQLTWSLIATKLIEDNNISVSPDDIKDAARMQLMSYMGGQSFGDLSWMDDYAERMMKDKKFVEQTYSQVQMGKLFQALESQVGATEEPVSAEAFAEKLHHHH